MMRQLEWVEKSKDRDAEVMGGDKIFFDLLERLRSFSETVYNIEDILKALFLTETASSYRMESGLENEPENRLKNEVKDR